MDKNYNPNNETKIYDQWLEAGVFTPKVPDDPIKARKEKEPFTIILPPPNANDPLHAGHALYCVEDVMVRFHRMLGDPTLWLPGTDHAGIETQFVFEKYLQKEGKSRFEYDRETLYRMISEFVDKNKGVAMEQMKRLGFSLDWSRLKFTLDPEHNQRINEVFGKMCRDGLVYRDEKIVNYCTYCGTSFSNLEVQHKTVASHLWFLRYSGITVATTRPETMLGDTAVAVNPNDKRYLGLIGSRIKLPLVNREIPIIGEETVDMEFGTGAVKVTPSHSPEDYEMAKKHGLDMVRIMDYNGKFNNNVPEKYRGLYANKVRELVVEDMDKLGLLEKTIDYTHEVGHCYKCGRPIEPITSPQWFVRIESLAKRAVEAVKNDKVTIFPKRFKKSFLTWMKDIRDWNISRQIVWGQRIPVWYSLEENPGIILTFINRNKETVSDKWSELKDNYSFEEIVEGLQNLLAPAEAKYYLSQEEAGETAIGETDTFDTWFSSGQWPYSTLGWSIDGKHSKDFEYFYPTTVLDTMWDILFFWVARMIMMGLYTTGEVPFKVAHMHSRVVDGKGQKMSKSKGNVINPIDLVEKYGADALRMALIIGVAPGSDIPLSDDKVRAQRNFVNKIWNAARFVTMLEEKIVSQPSQELEQKTNELVQKVTENIESYHFGQAAEDLYHFFWHELCDTYIEKAKTGEISKKALTESLATCLKMLHPFMPFVTEAVYQQLKDNLNWSEPMLITAKWPTYL